MLEEEGEWLVGYNAMVNGLSAMSGYGGAGVFGCYEGRKVLWY